MEGGAAAATPAAAAAAEGRAPVSAVRGAPARVDPDQAKRRRLDDQLRLNANILRELDAMRRLRSEPLPTESERRLASSLLKGLATAATYVTPREASLSSEPLATFVGTARGMNLIPLQRDFEPKQDVETGTFTQAGRVVPLPPEEPAPTPLPEPGITLAGLEVMLGRGQARTVHE
mmetsp:Transcript_33765/g.86310  ORF Transcript_33765/g.86310 Transcript_33765/m.86310 type:complete len:176 (-) Transcript_33765:226-753(-)